MLLDVVMPLRGHSIIEGVFALLPLEFCRFLGDLEKVCTYELGFRSCIKYIYLEPIDIPERHVCNAQWLVSKLPFFRSSIRV